MKKTLSMILTLMLVSMLFTGTVLAKPNDVKVNGQKVLIQEQIKMSVQIEYQAYCSNKPSQAKSPFADINQHWATQYITDMSAVGLLKGYPDGTFKPNQQLTQAEALSLAVRVADEDAVESDTELTEEDDSELADVPAWVRGDAGKAAKKGIIKLNRFHSAKQASRAQTAVMVAKALGLEPVDTADMPFKDGLLISREDVGYILALYEEGIIKGTPNGNFNPNSSITRAEMATILQKLLEKSEIESVTLPETATVEQGKSVTLEAAVKYGDGTTDKEVTWSTSDAALATVENGVVTAASDAVGTVYITATATRGETIKSAVCAVTIVEAVPVISGVLTSTDNVGGHDGKVYEEYVLKADDVQISLAEDMVKSITLQQEGSDAIQLTPNTDTSLWFNVQHETGKYTLTVIDINDKKYEASIDWTAPTAVSAVATGEEKEQDGNTYVEYKLGDLDLSSFTNMYQIKPDGQVAELTASSDTNLWFQTNGQVSGEHLFLIEKDGIWSSSSITI